MSALDELMDLANDSDGIEKLKDRIDAMDTKLTKFKQATAKAINEQKSVMDQITKKMEDRLQTLQTHVKILESKGGSTTNVHHQTNTGNGQGNQGGTINGSSNE